MPMPKWISSENSRVSSDFASHGMTISSNLAAAATGSNGRAGEVLGRAISQMEGDRADHGSGGFGRAGALAYTKHSTEHFCAAVEGDFRCTS